MRFIEDNGRLPRINGFYGTVASASSHMFTFADRDGCNGKLDLDPTTGQSMNKP